MTSDMRLRQGTPAWFEMVGTIMVEAARRASLSEDLNVSLVERYSDGVLLSEGVIQGIRFEITGGAPSYRVGVRLDEKADIVIEVTAAAARELNALHGSDPKYAMARKGYLDSGEMQVQGDIALLGAWLETVHDPIVDSTSR